MPTQIITGDNANEATFSGASDGAFTLRVGPNGAKVDGLSVDATGNVDILAGLTQQGGEAVPRTKQFTAQATTSGTFVDFTGIPSWAKKITVMLNGVSGSGTSSFRIQLGTSGGVENTGYGGSNTSSTTTTHSTAAWAGAGADLGAVNAAANQYSGNVTMCLVSGNTWTISGSVGGSNASYFWHLGGAKTLSGTLDRIRLTTVNGTDTFDAGSVNILVEGY